MAVNALLWGVYCAMTISMDELTGLIMRSIIDCFVVVSVRFMMYIHLSLVSLKSFSKVNKMVKLLKL